MGQNVTKCFFPKKIVWCKKRKIANNHQKSHNHIEIQIENLNIQENNIVIQQNEHNYKKELYQRRFFYENEMLNVLEDSHVEFKNYKFPFSSDEINQIKKTICSFLNSFGGRIYLGIQDKNLKVQGIQLFGYQIDRLKNIIHNLTRQFKPRVDEEVQIKIIPIKTFQNQIYIEGKYIIKIIVRPGQINEIYSTNDDQCYLRRDGSVCKLNITEIKHEIIKRYGFKEQYKIQNTEEFNDPEPEQITLMHEQQEQQDTHYSNYISIQIKKQDKFDYKQDIDNQNYQWEIFDEKIDQLMQLIKSIQIEKDPIKIIPSKGNFLFIEFSNSQDCQKVLNLIDFTSKLQQTFPNPPILRYANKKKYQNIITKKNQIQFQLN